MELSIDTASDLASILLSEEGILGRGYFWQSERQHTVMLMPEIDRLLSEAGVAKSDLSAVFVCLGPGMYTGLRVGVSVAKGLAYALKIPIVGVGRLEADAYTYSSLDDVIVPVHGAGRGEYAWAAYSTNPWTEVAKPRLDKAEALAVWAHARNGTIVGEVDDRLRQSLEAAGGATVIDGEPSTPSRAHTIAALGRRRLAAGDADEAALLAPLYLRPPAIGPQPPPELVQIDPVHLRYSRHEGISTEHPEGGEQCSSH